MSSTSLQKSTLSWEQTKDACLYLCSFFETGVIGLLCALSVQSPQDFSPDDASFILCLPHPEHMPSQSHQKNIQQPTYIYIPPGWKQNV